MKYNFSEIVCTTIIGEKVVGLEKSLANAIYTTTKDLGLVKVAKDIYEGKEVEITVTNIEEIKRIISDERNGFFSFAQKAIIDFIEK